MSKLDELINELCPDGVEYKPLEKVAKISNGKDHKHLDDGKFPVYGSGGIMRYASQCIYDQVSVLIPRKGSIGNIFYVDTPFWTVDTIFYTKIDFEQINARFFFHYLLTQNIENLNTAGGVPSLTKAILDKIEIPLPPLPVQEEIVRILDKFTELTAELTARKKQYEYYRDNLLTFDNEDFEWKTLGAITNLSRGVRVVRSQLNSQDKYPVYQNSLIPLGYFNKSNYPAKTTFIISAGAAGSVGYSDIDFWAADDCYCLVCPKWLDSRYLYHALNNQQNYIFSQVRKASIPRIGRDVVEKIKIPIPYPNDLEQSLKEQHRIVDILDRFDILCNDISTGLPAEIKTRQKQYEYYRDKLLTFKEKLS